MNNQGVFYIEENKDIYVSGDIHGDYELLIHIMVDLAKVCSINNNKLSWKPNNDSIIIFCGDTIHRKRFLDHVLDDENSDILILETIMRLQDEAEQYNGKVIFIAGNHEIMNIIYPEDTTYISEKNIDSNQDFFTNQEKVKKLISRTFAWIKINDTLIAHGGLCSDYLGTIEHFGNILKDKQNVVSNVNNIYRDFFSSKDRSDKLGHSLFINYPFDKKYSHNMFWCREWGYGQIDCNKFKSILETVNCKKMIISHCPQFLSSDKPKTITFECINSDNSGGFNLARIDLGMSRCFDYNLPDKFMFYLATNHLRKISILKLVTKNKELILSPKNIISSKLSTIQYILIKYGITEKQHKQKNFSSNWLGFEIVREYIKRLKKQKKQKLIGGNLNEEHLIINNLLEPVLKKIKLDSIQ